MAKSYEWTNDEPQPTGLVANGDDAIRRLRLEIQERMSDIANWTADPVTLLDSIFAQTGKILVVHGTAFKTNVDTASYDESGISLVSGTSPLIAPISLPVGATVTGIRFLVTSGDAATLDVYFMGMNFDSPVSATTLAGFSTSTSGTQFVGQSSGAEIPIVGTRAYFARVIKSSGASFSVHGVEITYSTASL